MTGALPNGCAATAGKRESGAPTFTMGGSIRGSFGPVSAGIQAKRTGPRFVNAGNDLVRAAKSIGTYVGESV